MENGPINKSKFNGISFSISKLYNNSTSTAHRNPIEHHFEIVQVDRLSVYSIPI